jgi:hypothetical protein
MDAALELVNHRVRTGRVHSKLGVVCLLLSGGAAVAAQDFPVSPNPDTITARKVTSAPTIDGTIEAAEWSGAITSSRSLVSINTTKLTGDKGQYWIGYDDEYIYIGARILLVNPKKINADEFRQNVSLRGNDAVTLLLDVHGTAAEFNSFTFNASGATQLELAGGRASKQEWLGKFDAAGQITETGWEGEAKIAWSLMSLPSEGTRDLKFLIDWYASYNQQGLSFHSTQGDLTKMHTLSDVDVPKVVKSNKVHVLPYVYGGVDEDGNEIVNAGVDLKTSLGDNLTLVGTINPDFRNIENDVLDLDFSNFERLPDESRPFFLEGSEFINTGQVNNRSLFAPQRIGSFDTGFNVYGSLNSQSQIGVLTTLSQDGDNTAVGSYNYNIDPTSSIRTSFAALDRTGESNISTGVDYFKRSGDYLLFGAFQQSDDDVTGIGTTLSYGTQYSARGLTGILIMENVSDDFNPRIGYAPQTGFKGGIGVLRYHQTYTDGPLIQSGYGLTTVQADQFGGGHYRELYSAMGTVALKSGLGIELQAMHDHLFTMRNTFYSVNMQFPRNDPYRGVTVGRTMGNVAGEEYTSTTVGGRYRPVKRLQLAARHQMVDHFAENDQTVFTFNWEMDKYRSIGGRVVGTDDEWNWFASYSMRGNLGAEYFLIAGDPNANTFQNSVILKAVLPVSF